MREGTARFAVTVGQNDKHLQKIIQRQLNNSGVSLAVKICQFLFYFMNRILIICHTSSNSFSLL